MDSTKSQPPLTNDCKTICEKLNLSIRLEIPDIVYTKITFKLTALIIMA